VYIVEKMAVRLSVSTEQLVGNAALVTKLEATDFIDERVGLPTLRDMLAELSKPGRRRITAWQQLVHREQV